MTKVIFRKFKNGFGIIALFPEHQDWSNPNLVMSYMHIGQHSQADYNHIISITKPATEEEYKDLYDELECVVGDDLKVYKKRIR